MYVWLLGALLACASIPVTIDQVRAADGVWIPASSNELTPLVRRIEESLETGVEAQILDSLAALAERLVDGDPGGTTPVGGGLHVGAGVYLRATVARLQAPLRDRVIDEIRLRTLPRIPETPVPGLDARADRRRTCLLMDLPLGAVPASLARSLAESALERGDLHSWQRSLELRWIENPGLESSSIATTAEGPPIVEDEVLIPIDCEAGVGESDRFEAPWQFAQGRVGAVSDDSRVWIQFPGEIRAIDLASAEEIWRRVLPQQHRDLLPRTILRPIRRGSMIIASLTDRIEALDGSTGQRLWQVDLDAILGPEEKPQAIRALSSPCKVPGGIVVVAVASEGDRVEAFASHIDERGRILWVRHLGETTGSTWLALQASPATPVAGTGRIHWSSGRGSVITLRTSDGAVEWMQDLNSPSSFGLRNHLMQNPASGQLLRRSGFRLFALPPGAPGISILDARNGQILETIPTRSARRWCLSSTGDSLVVIEGSELVCWSCGSDDSPRFLWRSALPAPLSGEIADVIAAAGGGWWVSSGDAIISYSPEGVLQSVQGIGASSREMQPLDGAILTRSGVDVRILVPSETAKHDLWTSVLTGHYPRQSLDLSGDSPQQEALRRTVELRLERSDLVLPETERFLLESALIGAESHPPDRIASGWQRAVHSLRAGALGCATLICTRMLDESPRLLATTLVESRNNSWVPAEAAFTHLLLELDRAAGGPQRVAQREVRAVAEARELADFSSPARWQTLALMRPGCATGRNARLEAAEAYYRIGDLDRCLHQIDLLIVREPDSDEAVIGKLRRCEVLREQGRLRQAIDQIEQLNRSDGDRPMTRIIDGIERTVTLGERLQQLRNEITKLPEVRRNHPGLPLHRAWSGRLELGQTRSSEIWPLSGNEHFEDDSRVLILTSSSAQLLDSRDGVLLWRTDLNRDPIEIRGSIILSRRDLPSAPVHIDDTGLIFHDRTKIWRLQLEDGVVAWSHRIRSDDDLPDQEIRIAQSCAGAGTLITVTEDQRIIAFDARSGQRLWTQPRRGALLDDPVIRDERLLIGYAIPDMVELRSMEDGEILQQLKLEEAAASLASTPVLVPGGFIVALEGGNVSRYSDDGETLWTTDLPHIISQMHPSPSEDQLVCELYWRADRPTLLGLDMKTGKVGWQRHLSEERRRITALQIDADELLLVCGDFQKRTILKLRSTLGLSLLAIPEAELEWTHQLAPAYDSVNLQPRGDWVVVADRLRGEVTILDRSTGTPLTSRQGIQEVTDHIKPLGRLHHASVVGDTLFTVSSRGAAGFRSVTARKREITAWKSLQESTNWKDEAVRLLDLQESHKAIDLIERTILDLNMDPLQRATASWMLEGAARQQALEARKDHQIARMQVAPIIDGSLDEPWNATRGIPLERPRFIRGLQGPGEPRIPWQDRADLSGRVFLGWSEEGLHIAVDIDDDNTTSHDRDAKRWIGDCLILVLDTKGDGGVRPRSDDQVLTLAFVPPRPQPVPEEGETDESGEDPPPFRDEDEDGPEGEHIVVRKADGTGAVYEMTIPWKGIAEQRGEDDFVPWPGMRMRIGIAVTDDDTGSGATKYLALTPGMVLHRDLDRIWEGCCPDLMLPVRLDR